MVALSEDNYKWRLTPEEEETNAYWDQVAIDRLDNLTGNRNRNRDGDGDGNDRKKQTKKKEGDNKDDKKSKPTHLVYKYSQTIPLAEQIILNGKNVFLQIIDSKPVISSSIDLGKNMPTIKPQEIIPFIPYVFKDEKEINDFIKQARLETLDSLYFQIKSLCKQLIVTRDNETLVLIASDILYSYFVDHFATTHYVFIKASPGHGKGAIMGTVNLFGYRVVLASGLSGANLLDIMGSDEPCQVTLVEDEYSDNDKDEFKRKILKVGYDVNGRVFRTLEGNTSARHNRVYLPYGLKILGAENPPEAKDLEGLVDRLLQIESIKAKPKFYVKTITNEMQKPLERQNPKYKDIITEITHLHKLLLIYRILHHQDIIEEANLNIDGRAYELTSPQIYLFSSKMASDDKKALNEILPALSKFLEKKGELQKRTLEGIVYESLNNLFEKAEPKRITDLDGQTKILYTIKHEDIIYEVKVQTNGVDSTIPNEKAFYSTDYDKVSHRRVLNICKQRFFGDRDYIGTGVDKARALTFDKETVDTAGKTFEVITKIEILDSSVPVPSQFRPTKNSQNRAQSEQVGTVGRNFNDSRVIRDNETEKVVSNHDFERENDGKMGIDNDSTSYPGNDQMSVPTSQGNGRQYRCYHNGCDFQTCSQEEYERHGALKHPKNPLLYPSRAEIEKYGLKPQGKSWEK
jgi:hypothetical protein